MSCSGMGFGGCDTLFKGLVGCSLITNLLFVLCISVTSFVIGAQNWDTQCDNACFMSMSLWVVLIAIFSLIFSVGSVIIYIFKHKEPMDFYMIYGLIAWIFVTPFAIMGAVILNQQAGLCYNEAYPLWAVFMTAFVLDWIIVAVTSVLVLVGLCACSIACCKTSRS